MQTSTAGPDDHRGERGEVKSLPRRKPPADEAGSVISILKPGSPRKCGDLGQSGKGRRASTGPIRSARAAIVRKHLGTSEPTPLETSLTVTNSEASPRRGATVWRIEWGADKPDIDSGAGRRVRNKHRNHLPMNYPPGGALTTRSPAYLPAFDYLSPPCPLTHQALMRRTAPAGCGD